MVCDIIETNLGSCISFRATWPREITGKTIRIQDAQPASLANATITPIDDNTFAVLIPESITSGLPRGLRSSFRLAVGDAGGCFETTPPIRINVQ